MKRERGITLIALVITIIVLLILAGVSISLTLGNNGVLNQATNSVTKTRNASAKEEVEMAWAGAESDYWSEWTNNSGFTKDANFYDTKLKAYLSPTGYNISVTDGEDSGTYEVNYTSNDQNQPYIFIIDENGKADLMKNGNASEIASDSSNIGKAVNYDKTYIGSGSGWQILYADASNVYIITTGYVTASNLNAAYTSGSGYNGISDFENLDAKKYPSVSEGWLYGTYKNGNIETSITGDNFKAAEYLLDSSLWNETYKNSFAKWCIGGPTLELFLASYNTVNTTKMEMPTVYSYGYGNPNPNTIPNADDSRPWNHNTSYWLACPHSTAVIAYVNTNSREKKIDYENQSDLHFP